ncbi:hypothetical protein FRC02_003454 [Tulasnella sp. 418]|nr:hypothetical protein FRC02_003454 [Tulasnella sp. 418]
MSGNFFFPLTCGLSSPVYEYPLNNQWIMMDVDDGYVLWTGIWKALGNSKADIVKMIETQPDLASQIRRVRGGYLKIQGSWIPYDFALKLARRVAWPIREDLVPLFGPTFPSTCLSPDQPGYGQLVDSSTRRRARRSAVQPVLAPADAEAKDSLASQQNTLPTSHPVYSPISTPGPQTSSYEGHGAHPQSHHGIHHPNSYPSGSAYNHQSNLVPRDDDRLSASPKASSLSRYQGPQPSSSRHRYAPYPTAVPKQEGYPYPVAGTSEIDRRLSSPSPHPGHTSEYHSHSHSRQSSDLRSRTPAQEQRDTRYDLPSISSLGLNANSSQRFILPPIAALKEAPEADASSVLRRLKLEDQSQDDSSSSSRHLRPHHGVSSESHGSYAVSPSPAQSPRYAPSHFSERHHPLDHRYSSQPTYPSAIQEGPGYRSDPPSRHSSPAAPEAPFGTSYSRTHQPASLQRDPRNMYVPHFGHQEPPEEAPRHHRGPIRPW